MTQRQTAGVVIVLIVGLLMMGGCDGASSTNGSGMGQVMIQPPVSPLAAALGDNNPIKAVLDIDGGPTGIEMHRLSNGQVQATVPGVPVGLRTFRITYTAQDKNNSRVTLMTAEGTGNVVAGATTSVGDLRTNKEFDDDNDGARNFDEVAKNTDPKNPTDRPTNAIEVVAGGSHACAILVDHTLRCWGNNSYGQLGADINGFSTTGVKVRNGDGTGDLSGVEEVTVGGSHTCARLTDGTVQCWGDNSFGQLGDNRLGFSSSHPVTVVSDDNSTPLSRAEAIAAGGSHTCARLSDRTVQCWGDNSFGQLGNNSQDFPSPLPVSVKVDANGTKLGEILRIAAGLRHTCAITDNNRAWCWGDNSFGQLGKNRLSPPSLIAVQVVDASDTALTGVAVLATGSYHTCVVIGGTNQSGGTVHCWGMNLNRQLGNGRSDKSRPSPVPVLLDGNPLDGILQVAAGLNHTCARGTDGKVRCWGANFAGQLGKSGQPPEKTPIPVLSQIEDVSALSTGSDRTCAVKKADGTVYCWGKQSADIETAPVTVKDVNDGDRDSTSLALGAQHSCRHTSAGTVECWGDNSLRQLGNSLGPVDGAGLSSSIPVPVLDAINSPNPPPTGPLLTGVSKVVSGSYHACGLIGDKVKCWGFNESGQLGTGFANNPFAPNYMFPMSVVVSANGPELTGVTDLVAGYGHTCALLTGGTVQCWGANSSGQLGDGSTQDALFPKPVSGLTGPVTALAAGLRHNCALLTGGTVQCWGANVAGQLGDNNNARKSSPSPVSVVDDQNNTLGGVTALAAKGLHTCAVIGGTNQPGGTVQCWGENTFGQLGNNRAGSPSFHAVKVVINDSNIPLNKVSQVVAGRNHTCAVIGRTNQLGGTVQCWGENANGQLGNANLAKSLIPKTVRTEGNDSLNGVQALAAGYVHTCATLDGGGIKCWGSNGFGQLGNGADSSAFSTIPVPIGGIP